MVKQFLHYSNQPQNLEKHLESFGKVTKTNNALRKGTDHIKKQIRIKSEIAATSNSPIPCLKQEFLATDLLGCLLYNI